MRSNNWTLRASASTLIAMHRLIFIAILWAAWPVVMRAAVMTEQEGGFSLRDGPMLLVDTPWLFSDRPRLSITNSASGPMVNEAVEMFRATNGLAAIEALRQASGTDPNNADLIVARAWLFVRQQRFSEALDLARQAKLLAPTDPTADLIAGYCFHALGRTNDSLRAYEDALRYPSVKLPDIHQNVALLLVMQHDLTNALPHFAKAEALRPDDPDAHEKYGSALLMAGQPKAAVVHLREAVHLRSRFPKALVSLGIALEQVNDIEGSIDVLVRAIEMQPERSDAWSRLLKTLSHIYDDDEIGRALRAHQIAPDNPGLLRALVPLFERANRKRLATVFASKATLLDQAVSLQAGFK